MSSKRQRQSPRKDLDCCKACDIGLKDDSCALSCDMCDAWLCIECIEMSIQSMICLTR